MNQKELRTTFGHPTPELPVADVERAQEHYRDSLGFEIGWLYPGKEIGAVSRDNVVIFFRRRSQPFEPSVHWVFAADIELPTTNCARWARESLSLSKRSPGVCVNSQWKTSMATASIFIATKQSVVRNRAQAVFSPGCGSRS